MSCPAPRGEGEVGAYAIAHTPTLSLTFISVSFAGVPQVESPSELLNLLNRATALTSQAPSSAVKTQKKAEQTWT